MRVLVLGSAAGGGFPQWNCNCHNCSGLRDGTLNASARTQSSIAVTSNSRDWVLINASPDILTQLKSFRQLQPSRSIRDTGIRAIILVDSQLDHTLGLAMLREGARLEVYCTASVRSDLTDGNPLFRILGSYCGVNWHELRIDGVFGIPGIDGVQFTAVAVPGKAPPYSPHRTDPQPDDNVALKITDLSCGQTLFYAPGLSAVDSRIWGCMNEAACILVDGTFWTDDEMLTTGAGRKRASEMGHLALSGDGGMLSWLRRLGKTRKILIHINNTNPILDENSAERRELDKAGVETARDGMEISLGS
jgi:pyrroloquinoline quinone biosynthesis protein B